MPAFGLDGPWRERVGFAPTMEQIAGLAWVTGLPDDPPVTPRGACDPLAGVHAAFAVLAALNFAERTGVGQQVELPMIETVLNVTAIQPIEYEVFGVTLSRRGNRGHGGVIQNLYRCAGPDDDWIAVTVRDRRAVARAGRSDGPTRRGATRTWPASPDGKSGPTRSIAGCRTGSRSSRWEATVERLAGAGIPAAPVVSPSLVTENPQLRDRGFFEELAPLQNRTRPVSLPAVRPAGRPAIAGCTGRRRPWASTMKRCCAIGAG